MSRNWRFANEKHSHLAPSANESHSHSRVALYYCEPDRFFLIIAKIIDFLFCYYIIIKRIDLFLRKDSFHEIKIIVTGAFFNFPDYYSKRF